MLDALMADGRAALVFFLGVSIGAVCVALLVYLAVQSLRPISRGSIFIDDDPP